MSEDVDRPEPVRKVRADALERAGLVWEARVLGRTWAEAAQVAGYSDATNARKAVVSAYGRAPEIDRDRLREVWRARVEEAYRINREDMTNRVPGATTAFVRIADRAARLDGLDEPSRVEVSNPSHREIAQWVSDVIAASNGHMAEEADIFADVVDADVVETDDRP